MASYQYVYHMENVSKTLPRRYIPAENIHLNFLPGVKIGVVGVNGAGKPILLEDHGRDGQGLQRRGREAAKGAVGYLVQGAAFDSAERPRKTSCWAWPNSRPFPDG